MVKLLAEALHLLLVVLAAALAAAGAAVAAAALLGREGGGDRESRHYGESQDSHNDAKGGAVRPLLLRALVSEFGTDAS